MARDGSVRDQAGDFFSRRKQPADRRAAAPSNAQAGNEDAKRFAYDLGRRGHAVNEYTLKKIISEKDFQVIQEIEFINARFKSLEGNDFNILTHVRHSLAMFFGLIIVVGALLVDYRIIHEFWTRVAMDEVGKIAASLKLSVYFKSAQVVFATLAFHFMLETLNEKGRKLFIRMVFWLTAVMLVGIGVIVALKWLPAGSALFGVNLNSAAHSGRDILASLGLAAPSAAGEGSSLVKSIETGIWLASLSMIFIIVTSVGALSLQLAVHQFQYLSGAKVDDPDQGDTVHGLTGNRSQRLEQLALRARRFGVDPENKAAHDYEAEFAERKRSIHRCLLDFAGAYAEGLHAYQNAYFGLWARSRESRVRDLLTELKHTMTALGPFVDEFIARRHDATEAASPGEAEREGGNIEHFPRRGSGRRS